MFGLGKKKQPQYRQMRSAFDDYPDDKHHGWKPPEREVHVYSFGFDNGSMCGRGRTEEEAWQDAMQSRGCGRGGTLRSVTIVGRQQWNDTIDPETGKPIRIVVREVN